MAVLSPRTQTQSTFAHRRVAPAPRVLRGVVAARLRDAVEVLSTDIVGIGARARARARARGQSAARGDARLARAAAAVERGTEVGRQGGRARALARVRLRGQEREAPRVRALACTIDQKYISHMTDTFTNIIILCILCCDIIL